jgi:sporulation protein YlmC with PRC-barrel domain
LHAAIAIARNEEAVPLIRLTDTRAYRLVHPDQDWRGWPVVDPSGTPLGRVADFLIDTEEGCAVSLLLNTSRQVPIDAVTVADGHLVLARSRRPGGEPGPFENGTYDVLERAQEIVILKRPKVMEELVVSREVSEQQERIRATVRRLDVQVDRHD